MHMTVLAGVALTIWAARLHAFQQPAQQKTEQKGGQGQLERGRYLVHDVAQCVVCHSPKDARGNVVERRLLTGSPMPAKSPYRDIDWAFYCPQLVGLPGWEKDDAIYLLRHGHRRNGRAPRPPMPTFRMTEEDATAVVEYLMSLRP
jgi:mono/diheme cytochrome c family protein